VRIFCAGALAAGVLCGALTPASAAGHSGAGDPPSASIRVVHAGANAVPLSSVGRALAASQSAGLATRESVIERGVAPGTTPYGERPWIEGYDPAREDELFRATYALLPTHNILKIYVSDAGDYDAAGIRFSARVPHTMRDIEASEMEHEAALLVRTAFDRFPGLQALDIWATIPVDKSELTSVENTVFSISADRATYSAIRTRGLSDEAFLSAFGRVWLAPQVPR